MAVRVTEVDPLIDVDDAKRQLNIPLSDSSQDVELADFVLAASETINWYAGQSDAATFTDWITPNWGVYGSGYVSMTLTQSPVLSVVSIQPQFYQVAALDLSDLNIDAESGTIWVPTSQLFLGPCVVTYTVGRSVRPAVLQLACRFLVQDLWGSQRGASVTVGPLSGQIPGVGAVSERVATLLEMTPYHAMPGFA